MKAIGRIGADSRMASRWRRRRMCILVGDTPAPAALRDVSARGAFLETNARPPMGATVQLHHPDAGIIEAVVRGATPEGIELGFTFGEVSVAFALAAITADMSRPAA